MSYLDSIRLHFAGEFRADVSTVNNDSAHFDNHAFSPDDRLPQTAGAANGWWQPEGTGAWRLDACRITGGASTGADITADPVIGLRLMDSGDQVSAKLVDLDPNQQLVSTIFGLEMRIVDTTPRVLVRGRFEPAAFYDIWNRATGGGGDVGASVFFQSRLTDVVWADVGFSPLLTALKAASEPGFLSVRFMTDRYAMSGPRRGYGRIVGTIGPHRAGEPSQCVRGRHLAPAGSAGSVGWLVCRLDPGRKQLIADFGNAIQTNGDVLAETGALTVAAIAAGRVTELGTLTDYTRPGWYETTAGIVEFGLDAAALTVAETAPLAVVTPVTGTPGQVTTLASEASDGLFARPDDFVVRLEPGTSQDVPIVVTRFGKPLAGATIGTKVSRFGLQPQHGIPLAAPPAALQVMSPGATDSDGRTVVRLTGADPGRPRSFLDGQVYAVELRVAGAENSGTDFDSSCFISVLLFSQTAVPDHVEWQRDVLPILQQYANLYPRPHGPDRYVPFQARPPLHPVVNLADPAAVATFARRIHGALSLPFDHPNHMPVVRDLSKGRRAILLRWMEQILAGEPVPQPAPAVAVAGMAAAAAPTPPRPGAIEVAPLGSKTEALLKAKRGSSAPAEG